MTRRVEIILTVFIAIINIAIGVIFMLFNEDSSSISIDYGNGYTIFKWIMFILSLLLLVIFYDRIPVINSDGSETPQIIIRILGWILLVGVPLFLFAAPLIL